MGFLQLPATYNFNKVVISLWYRIPSSSADIVREQFQNFRTTDYFGMSGVVPLITFGPQQSDTIYDFGPLHIFEPAASGDWGFCNNGYDGTQSVVTGSHKANTPPSYIGIKFGGGPSNEGLLSVNLQTNQLASVTANYSNQAVGWNVPDGPACEPGSFILEDNSYIYTRKHLAFFKEPNWSGIQTDHWHHLLLSWDIGSSESGNLNDGDLSSPHSSFISTDAKMWLSHDDTNKDGNDLPANWKYGADGIDNSDRNSIVTSLIFDEAGTNGTGTISCSTGTLPTSPISIPAPSVILTDRGVTTVPVQLVEMAELQIFTGVTLDTSVVQNRRLFIDDKGKPVTDFKNLDTLLGDPIIRLHKSGAWKGGKNSGVGDKFNKTGTIKRWKPDPTLFGPQSPKNK